MKFYETKNEDYNVIMVASPYSRNETERLLNERYDNNVDPLKESLKELHEFELFTNCDKLKVGVIGIFDQHLDSDNGSLVTSTWQLVP